MEYSWVGINHSLLEKYPQLCVTFQIGRCKQCMNYQSPCTSVLLTYGHLARNSVEPIVFIHSLTLYHHHILLGSLLIPVISLNECVLMAR